MHVLRLADHSHKIVYCLVATALMGQGLSYGKIYASHIALLFSSVLLIFIDPVFFKKKILILPLSLLGYAALSLLWSSEPILGIKEVLQIGMGVGIVCCIYSLKSRHSHLLRILRTVCWINLILSALEAFEIFRYPLSLFSEWAIVFGKSQSNWMPQHNDIPTGFHWNPNNNAFFIVLFLPLIIRTDSWKSSLFYWIVGTFVIYMASSKIVLLAWLLTSTFTGISLLSQKRLKIVALSLILFISVFIVSLIMNYQNSRTEKYRRLIPSITQYFLTIPEIVVSRSASKDLTFDFKQMDLSLHERLVYIDGLIKYWNGHRILGLGAGSLQRKNHSQAGSELSLASPHAYFLELAVLFGVFFIVAYIAWLGALLKRSFKLGPPYYLSLIVFILFNPVISSAIYFLPKWVLFGLILHADNHQNLCESKT